MFGVTLGLQPINWRKSMYDSEDSLSGLTEEEAKEFHGLFMASFVGFTAVATAAHVLVWMWRPWIPSDGGYAEATGVIQQASTYLSMLG